MVVSFAGRTQEEYTRYMIQGVAAGRSDLTDFNPNSVVRTFLEAASLLAERLEEEALAQVAEGIDRSTYRSFGFSQRLATQATGVAVLTRFDTSQDQTVPAGTLMRVPSTTRQYATTEDVVLEVGIGGMVVSIASSLPGTFYNTPADTITQWIVAPTGAEIFVTNPSGIVNGTDDETDEERRVRFGEFIASIHRATPFAMEYGAKLAAIYDDSGKAIEEVYGVQIVDRYAIARCWIWNGRSTMTATTPAQLTFDEASKGASAALVGATQRIIDGYRDPATGAPIEGYKAAGVLCSVKAATVRVQPVNLLIYPQTGYTVPDIAHAVRAAIHATFARQRVGSALLRLNDLRQAIGLTRGVVDHAILNPPADVVGGDGVVIVPGAIGIAQG